VSNSSGTSSNPFTQNLNKDKSNFKIPKKTQNLYSKADSEPEVDYDDDVVDDFVSRIFDSKSSSTIPSNSPKVNIHLKKGVGKLKFRSEPENTELKSGPEKADSDPVSKSQESKRRRKEEENPGFNPVNPEIGVETNQLPEFGSNPTPDPS
jgi:hypothetical protein